MGGKCDCRKNIHTAVDDIHTTEIKRLDHLQIMSAKKIMLGFYIVHFRKKTKEISKKTLQELGECVKKSQSKEDIQNKRNQFRHDFFKDLAAFQEKMTRYQYEKEVEGIDRISEVSQIREVLKAYYTRQIYENHKPLMQKIVDLLPNGTNLLSSNNVQEKKNNTEASKESSYDIIKNEINIFFDICLNKKQDNNSNQKSTLLQLLLASSYNDMMNKNGESLIPINIKKFLMKLFFLALVKRSEYMSSTGDDYKKFFKKEIRRVMYEKNSQKLKRQDIITENYHEFFDLMANIEKDEDNKIQNTLSKCPDQEENFIPSPNKKVNFLSHVPTFTLELKKAHSGAIDVSDLHHRQISNEEQNTSNSPEVFGRKVDDVQIPFVKRARRMLPSERRSSIEKSKFSYDYYNGEYDIFNYLYCGTGVLYKDRKPYFYEGTFRMGKKNGYGILYKKSRDSNSGMLYYAGEWANNKHDGYGTLIRLDNKKTLIRKGVFCKGVFVKGKEISYEEGNEIIFQKYEGNFLNEQYSGSGTLTRKTARVNKNNKKFELESEYSYQGDFSNGKENGRGKAKTLFKIQNTFFEYSGDFQDSRMHGYGIISYSEPFYIKTYEGFFENDKKCTKYGRVEFRSGDVYEGFFDQDHHKSYVGLYQHYDKTLGIKGDNFFGRFERDKKNGFGRFISPQTYRVLVGRYIEGTKNGNFSVANEYIEGNEKEFTTPISYSNGPTGTSPQSSAESVKNGINVYDKCTIKQMKMFYYFESDEMLDKASKPITE